VLHDDESGDTDGTDRTDGTEAGDADDPDGTATPAVGRSRARVAAHGWLPWAAGAAAVSAQLLIFVAAPERWRGGGSVVLAAVTLAAVGMAAFGRNDGEGPG